MTGGSVRAGMPAFPIHYIILILHEMGLSPHAGDVGLTAGPSRSLLAGALVLTLRLNRLSQRDTGSGRNHGMEDRNDLFR